MSLVKITHLKITRFFSFALRLKLPLWAFVLIYEAAILLPYAYKLSHILLIKISYPLYIIINFAIHYLIFSALVLMRKIGFCLAIFIFAFLTSIYSASLVFFNYKMSNGVIASALENDTSMIDFYVNSHTALYVIAFTLIVSFFTKITWKTKPNIKICLACVATLLLSFAMLCNSMQRLCIRTTQIMDIFYLLHLPRSFESGVGNVKYLDPKGLFSFKNDSDINVVFVIGESARADFFHKYVKTIDKYGINRITSISNSDNTRQALPVMLSVKDGEKLYSIVDIMKSLGFKTHWIGAQNIRGKYDSTYAYFAVKSDVSIYTDPVRNINYDMELLPILDNFTHQKGKNFYIIHQIGSHVPYANKFTEDFAIQKPYCKSENIAKCTHEETTNAYINSILYTDHFLSEVLSRFSKSNTLLFYSSDHGTDILSINKNENTFTVPAFFYTTNSGKKSIIGKNLKNVQFNHEKISPSLLGCIGVKSDSIKDYNNICS
ncbi:phosphoethanolamine transferase [Candidatus Deianiraea vastatrix]|uniref:EptB-like lipid A phosphoethanolamine transferase n=1 Tax=Candidatus Deianiraea vastatrix TaxID=2163644 RepID=A0A5B8XFJ0_9RICK|nr:phosphoethanolamine transferase [Candidatus Deianiraea vastatrix]QED23726.1 Putative EptB-like lipid A phosphoethanolamine transferase [Candidatus Deianiraea vastatrix]